MSGRWRVLDVILLTIFSLIPLYFIASCMMHHAVTPPSHVIDVHTFLRWAPSTDRIKVLSLDEETFYLAYGMGSSPLPSGPSAYVFDSTGHMVDWSSDMGDDGSFQRKWKPYDSEKRITATQLIEFVGGN